MNKRLIALVMLPLLALLYVTAVEVAVDEFQSVPTDGISFENFQGVVIAPNTIQEIRNIGRTLSRIRTTEGQRYALGTKYSITVANNDEEDGLFAAAIIHIDEDALVENIRNVRFIVAGFLEEEYGYSTTQADTLAFFLSFYNALHRGDLAFFEARYKPEIFNFVNADNVGIATNYSGWAGRTRFIIPLTDTIILSELDSDVIDLANGANGESNGDERGNLNDIKSDAVEDAQNKIDENQNTIDENEQRIAELEAEKAEREAELSAKEQEKEDLLTDGGPMIQTPDVSIFVIIRRPGTNGNDELTTETDVAEVVVREVDAKDLPADYDSSKKTEVSIQSFYPANSELHVQDVLVDNAIIEEYVDSLDGETKQRLVLIVTKDTLTEQPDGSSLNPDGSITPPADGDNTEANGSNNTGNNGNNNAGDNGSDNRDLSPAEHAELDRLNNEIAALEEEIARLEKEINDLKNANERLTEENKRREAEQEKLIEQIKNENEQLQKEKEELEKNQATDSSTKTEEEKQSEAENRTDQEANAKTEEEKQVEADKNTADEALKQAEADKKAAEEATKKAEADKKAAEEAAKKAEADKKAAEEATKKAEADKKAAEEAAKKAEADAKNSDTAKDKAEADKKAAEEARIKAEADAEEARLMNEGKVPVVGDLIFFMNSKAGTRNGHRRNEIISLNMLDTSIMNRSADNICSVAFVAFAGGVAAITEEGGRPESPHRLTLFDLATLAPKAISTVEIHWESFIYMAEGKLYAMAKDDATGNFVLARFNTEMGVEAQSEAIVDPETSITVNRNHIFVRTKDLKRIIVLNKGDLTKVGEVVL